MAPRPEKALLTRSLDQTWPLMFSVMRTSATVPSASASRRVRSFVSPSGSPITNGARVVRARWPAPRFVAPHSTVPTTRLLVSDDGGYAVLHEPVAEGDERLCQAPLHERTEGGLEVRGLEGNEGEVEGVLRGRQGRRGRRGGRGFPRPDRRGGGRGRAASRRAPRWRRGRSRAARCHPSSPPSRRRWRRPRLPGRSLRSWGRPRIDGREVLQELVQRGVAPVALQEQPLPLFVRVLEKARPALGARAPLVRRGLAASRGPRNVRRGRLRGRRARSRTRRGRPCRRPGTGRRTAA